VVHLTRIALQNTYVRHQPSSVLLLRSLSTFLCILLSAMLTEHRPCSLKDTEHCLLTLCANVHGYAAAFRVLQYGTCVIVSPLVSRHDVTPPTGQCSVQRQRPGQGGGGMGSRPLSPWHPRAVRMPVAPAAIGRQPLPAGNALLAEVKHVQVLQTVKRRVNLTSMFLKLSFLTH
jgi:hypothetical protein